MDTHLVEGQDRFICREDDYLNFEGCRAHCFKVIIFEGSHHEWRVLCQISTAFTKCYHEKTPRKTEECSFFFMKTILHHYTPLISMVVVRYCGIELVVHPHYSLDLTNICPITGKIYLAGKLYRNDDDIISVVQEF